MKSGRRRIPLIVGIIAFVAIAVYWRSLGHGFVWDDWSLIMSRPALDDWSQLGSNLTSNFFRETQERGNFDYWRPLVVLSHMLDRTLFATEPWGYHLVNLVLHASVSVLVFFLGLTCLGRLGPAALSGLIFAVHPVHVEVVAWVSGRSDLLFAAFFSIALLADWELGRTRKIKWRLLSLAGFGAALLSKEAAAVFPALVAARGYLISPTANRPRIRMRQALAAAVPTLIVLALYLGVRYGLVGVVAPDGVAVSATRQALFWTWWSASWLYFRLLLWPSTLTVMHDVEIVSGPGSLPVVVGFVAFSAVIFAAWRLRDRAAGAAWSLLILVVNLAPLSNFVVRISSNLESEFPFAERFLYVPSIGFCLFAAWLLAVEMPRVAGEYSSRLQRASPQDDREAGLSLLQRPPGVLLPGVVSGALVVMASFTTWHRCQEWKDEVSLFGAAVQESPESFTAQLNYGVALGQLAEQESDPVRRAGFLNDARAHYLKALEISPRNYRAHFNLGNLYRIAGEQDAAEDAYREALRLNPYLYQAGVNLGAVLVQKGLLFEALGEFERAERLSPRSAEAKVNRAHVLQLLGRPGEAIPLYREALTLDPGLTAAQDALERAQAAHRKLERGNS